ncbi:hypothetical protein [Phaeodactylibacter sp.]|uniref:hypothetical protein n=1 Tax=Phaeodactylibacter sp. TaxID=1940289 RepID=UPI0025CDD755|nr:hypothetical protein [Phaeodactylibacter sp.]MCI5091152.1 hypothetical protein [Phaeodactylibacter sp.]
MENPPHQVELKDAIIFILISAIGAVLVGFILSFGFNAFTATDSFIFQILLALVALITGWVVIGVFLNFLSSRFLMPRCFGARIMKSHFEEKEEEIPQISIVTYLERNVSLILILVALLFFVLPLWHEASGFIEYVYVVLASLLGFSFFSGYRRITSDAYLMSKMNDPLSL